MSPDMEVISKSKLNERKHKKDPFLMGSFL
jgi:hypothetical protein